MATLALSSCRKSSTRVRRYCTVWSLLMWPRRLYKVLAHCWGASFATWVEGWHDYLETYKIALICHLVSAALIAAIKSWYNREIFLTDHLRPKTGYCWKTKNTRHRADALTGGSSASWRAAPWLRPRAAVGRWSLRYSGLKKRGRLLLPSRH